MNNILKRPIITEKSLREAALGRFTFEAALSANKAEIAQAAKELFKVNPTKVQTITVKGINKRHRRLNKEISVSSYKKAVITLKGNEKIDLFDVVEEAPQEGAQHVKKA